MVQASGAGILMPLMQTVLFVIFPPEKRGVAMGIFGLIVAFAPAVGPTLSGWIVDQFQWRILFYLLLPIALIILLLAFFLVENITQTNKPKFDFLSIILSSLGFGGLLYSFSIAGSFGWTSPTTLGILIVAILALTWFITRQSHLAEPMLNFRVFTYKMFTLPMAMVIIVFVAFIGGMTILPIYMQSVLHYSALKSGLALMLGGIVMGILSPFTGRIYDQLGARPLAFVGLSFVTVSGFLLTKISSTTSFSYLTIAFVIMMIGEATVMMPLTTAALNALPLSMISHGTAMNNTIRQIAGAIGTAVLVTIMTSHSLDISKFGSTALVPGVQITFKVVTCLSLLGLTLAFSIKKKNI